MLEVISCKQKNYQTRERKSYPGKKKENSKCPLKAEKVQGKNVNIHIEETYEDGSKAKPYETEKNASNSQPPCCGIGTIHHDSIQNTY